MFLSFVRLSFPSHWQKCLNVFMKSVWEIISHWGLVVIENTCARGLTVTLYSNVTPLNQRPRNISLKSLIHNRPSDTLGCWIAIFQKHFFKKSFCYFFFNILACMRSCWSWTWWHNMLSLCLLGNYVSGATPKRKWHEYQACQWQWPADFQLWVVLLHPNSVTCFSTLILWMCLGVKYLYKQGIPANFSFIFFAREVFRLLRSTW